MTAFWNHDIAFVHIPKNGGTSTTKAFEHLPRRVDPRYTHGYEPASFYRDLIGPEAWDKKYSFAMVRNPWDRIASSYRFIVHKHPYKLFRTQPMIKVAAEQEAVIEHCKADFDWWLMEFCEKWAYWPGGLARRNRPFTRTPQSWWTHEGNDLRVTAIFNYEDMDDYWKFMKTVWGVERRHDNVTANGEDYRVYYSDKSREYVGEHFAEDIERFGYEF